MFQNAFQRMKNSAKLKSIFRNTSTNNSEQSSSVTVAPGCPEASEESKNVAEVQTDSVQNTWTLWYLKNDRSKSYEDMQNEIISFDAVEDFLSVYNYIKPPSEIKLGCDYSVLKKGIRPIREDAVHKQGGRWVIDLKKPTKSELDQLWLDVVLCLLGETFDNSDQIFGAVINIRAKSKKISIWTADANNQEAVLEIGYKLRDALCHGQQNLQYQVNKEWMFTAPSKVKSIYTL